MKIGVIAGTPVDVEFGVDFLARTFPEIIAIPCPISATPREQTAFQLLDEAEIHTEMVRQMQRLKKEGVTLTLIYCNSLSSVIKFERLRNETAMTIISPLGAYDALAKENHVIALMSANSVSLHNVTTRMQHVQPTLHIIGYCNLALVEAIEAKIAPHIIVKDFGLDLLMKSFEKSKVDQIVIGCTHFDYLESALRKETEILYSPTTFIKNQIAKYIQK